MGPLHLPQTMPTTRLGRSEFLALIERHDGMHIATCPEIPGVEGRGRTTMAALVDLRHAVAQTLVERRTLGIQLAPAGAVFDTIQVG